MTPSPNPSITSRVLDIVFGKRATPEDHAARAPQWVRLTTTLVVAVVMVAFAYTLVGKYGWLSLPWTPDYWPESIVFYGLMMAAVFAGRAVERRYARRDGREERSPQ